MTMTKTRPAALRDRARARTLASNILAQLDHWQRNELRGCKGEGMRSLLIDCDARELAKVAGRTYRRYQKTALPPPF